ncbi:MAG: CDP-diacylglycerol--glycerol-3-phosphate 3-phosphatidyltransferase [Candidatus Hydrogenedentota bacterium]|nr:MAG: CDP-diacylglycerol--glycerol-3-phosphate 3-phosphatidyltransferase [Candidatus Hydrogenedentota bacterium]
MKNAFWTYSNVATVLRAVAALLLIPLLAVNDPYVRLIGLFTFGVAALSDFFDGRMARRRNEQTSFGVIADPIADKALTGIGFLAVSLIEPRLLPLPLTLLILVREFGITAYRLVQVRNGRVIAADRWGKWKTGLQMTTIPVDLLIIAVLSGPRGAIWREAMAGTWRETIVFGSGLVLGISATILTVVSGIQFIRAERVRRRESGGE